MKTKVIFLIAISAIVTLSFTFTNIDMGKQSLDKVEQSTSVKEEPIGGFVSEDKF